LKSRALLRGLQGEGRRRIEAGEVKLVCISPHTGAAVRDLGLPVAAEAATYTTAGVVTALRTLAAGAQRR
jgi:uroporphyrinogen III methyltransferase / synthase